VASATCISALQTLVSRETNPNFSAVVTVGLVRAGVAHNVIAEDALLEGTLRATDRVSRERTLAGIQRIVAGIGALHGVETEVTFGDNLPAVFNSTVTTAVARKAAVAVVGADFVTSQGFPSLGGEDFSWYQQQTEGCLVRFGAQLPGNVGPAHSATFDFDEQVLPVGASWLAAVALEWLS
jgi:hippurate hydrolase